MTHVICQVSPKTFLLFNFPRAIKTLPIYWIMPTSPKVFLAVTKNFYLCISVHLFFSFFFLFFLGLF